MTAEKGVLKNRKRFLKIAGLNIDNLVVLFFQHKDKVYKATEKDLGKGARSSKHL